MSPLFACEVPYPARAVARAMRRRKWELLVPSTLPTCSKHGGWRWFFVSLPFMTFYRRLIDAVHGLEQLFLTYYYRQ